MNDTMDRGEGFTYEPNAPRFQCPKCGMNDYKVGTLCLMLNGDEGHYCMRCYVALLQRFVPRMAAIERPA